MDAAQSFCGVGTPGGTQWTALLLMQVRRECQKGDGTKPDGRNMRINGLLNEFPWIALIVLIVFYALLVGYSLLKGKKGEIPIDLENPDMDRRRPDVGSTDSRIMPRS